MDIKFPITELVYNKPIKNRILFLHGMNSKPFEDRVNILKACGAEVDAPQLYYQTDDKGVDLVLKLTENITYTHVVGHSFGGILAYYISNRYKIPALMFNPAFGLSNINYFEQIHILQNLQVHDKQYAVVGMQDDVVPPSNQLKYLNHATVWKVDDLGHKIDPTTFEKYFKLFFENEKLD